MNPIQEQELRAHIRQVCEKINTLDVSIQGIVLAGVHLLMKERTSMFEDVCDFHWKFNRQYAGEPRMLDELTSKFRIHSLHEELDEYELAETLEDKFDALIDLIYFALGTAHLHGFQRFEEGFKRVHGANMAKELSSPDAPSKRGPEFTGMDIIKPKGWTTPVLTDLLK